MKLCKIAAVYHFFFFSLCRSVTMQDTSPWYDGLVPTLREIERACGLPSRMRCGPLVSADKPGLAPYRGD